jgi:hypothetical protein
MQQCAWCLNPEGTHCRSSGAEIDPAMIHNKGMAMYVVTGQMSQAMQHLMFCEIHRVKAGCHSTKARSVNA